ncbi:Os02g0570600, partial [Oryza sativa Japonica Group]
MSHWPLKSCPKNGICFSRQFRTSRKQSFPAAASPAPAALSSISWSFRSWMIRLMTSSILLRLARPLRGATATIRASLDDGNRSATLSHVICFLATSSASRNSSRWLHRPPTELTITMSLASLLILSLRFTPASPPAPASAASSRTSRATSRSRTPWNDLTRAAVSSSCMQILRRWRHRSLYGPNMTSRPPKKTSSVVAVRWRSANLRSWCFRTSSATAGDDTTTAGTSPIHSCMMGPCFSDSARNERWVWGLFVITRWWRLPISGSVHGPGGRLSLGFMADDTSLERTTTN